MWKFLRKIFNISNEQKNVQLLKNKVSEEAGAIELPKASVTKLDSIHINTPQQTASTINSSQSQSNTTPTTVISQEYRKNTVAPSSGKSGSTSQHVIDELEAAREALRELHEINNQMKQELEESRINMHSEKIQGKNVQWKQELEKSITNMRSEKIQQINVLEEYFKADLKGVILTDEFKRTFDLMENTRDNLIITGKAGTGKSTLLKYFLVHTKKSAVALAPTGIAAINIGGDTIHKFFQLPWGIISSDDIKIRPNKLYENIDTLIIDEFSMVNANLLDAVDETLRGNGKKPFEPFGGVQIIFFGDFFQLPPVVKELANQAFFANEYGNPWFFSSHVFKRPDFTYKFVELQENHRQEEKQFMELLDNMRLGGQTQEQLNLLNSRFGADNNDISEYPIMLVPKNIKADDYNAYKLDELDTKEYVFEGKTEGEFPKDRFPTLPQLHLKVGAQVMTIVNNTNKGYVNGTIGKVISVSDDMIQIEVDSREGRHTCDVCRHTWENFRYHYVREKHCVDREKIGTFTQFPLKLAWSITVHKSQGLTFDAVTLDIGGGSFASGMAYVAVSRCRTLEGIRLHSRIRSTDVKVDPHARQFYLSNKPINSAYLKTVPGYYL